MSDEHKNLLKWWAERFPRERLGDENGPTWKGERALKELQEFPADTIQDAMNEELKRDRPKSIDHVISLLRTSQGQHRSEGTPSWLFGCFGGEVARRGSHVGLVVKEEGRDLKDTRCACPVEYQVWVPVTTKVYQRKHWVRVVPDSLEHGWHIMDPIKGGEVRSGWAEAIKHGEFDGGCVSRAMGSALRLAEEFVEIPQAPTPKPETPAVTHNCSTQPSVIGSLKTEELVQAAKTVKEEWKPPVLSEEDFEENGIPF